MIKDINKYIIISIVYNIVLVFASLELLNLCKNKLMYIVLSIYIMYKVVFEMYYTYRGIYISKKYSYDYKNYSIDKLCGYCKDKTVYKNKLYRNIISGIYSKDEIEKILKSWEVGLENYYSNKIYAAIFLCMNVVLVMYFGENAMGFCAIISLKIIMEGVMYSKEKEYLSDIKMHK